MSSLMRIPSMRGFRHDTVTAWWIICDQCNDSELVTGSTADQDALVWAGEHLREQHGGAIYVTAGLPT